MDGNYNIQWGNVFGAQLIFDGYSYVSDIHFPIVFPTDVFSCTTSSNEDRSEYADFLSISALNTVGFHGYNTYYDPELHTFPIHSNYHYGKYIAIGY